MISEILQLHYFGYILLHDNVKKMFRPHSTSRRNMKRLGGQFVIAGTLTSDVVL